MIVNQRWGFSAVIATAVGIGIGVLIVLLAGLGSGWRLVIGVGVGLLIGGGLLALFDRLIVRRLPAFDPETGEPLPHGGSSAFFGLSLEIWTLFLIGLGTLVVIVGILMDRIT